MNELQKRPATDIGKLSPDVADQVTIRLWSKMLELYGRLWEASYGHVDGDAFKAWRGALIEFTPLQIKAGLDALVKEGASGPPNLIKFLRLCREGSVDREPRTFSQDSWSEKWGLRLPHWEGEVPLEYTESKPWDAER